MVCAAECEAAEESCDDEAHAFQVPERSEGKTKEIKQQHLPFVVLKLKFFYMYQHLLWSVATTLTVYGIETPLPCSRRYHCPYVATVPSVCGVRRRGRGGRGAKRR